MIFTPSGPCSVISLERLLAGQHVAEVILRRQAEQHVDVAEAEVGVDDADAVAETGQRRRPD